MEQLELAAPLPDPASPVPPSERIPDIDVLRGFALLGILAANMRGFLAPASVYFTPELFFHSSVDMAVQTGIDTLASGKFITIFSMLFGVGFAIQLDRAHARGQDLTYYWRRSTWLLVFGLAHVVLLWFGDILHLYALAGFFLMLFRKHGNQSLLRWSFALYWVPMVFATGFLVASWLGARMPMPPPPTSAEIAGHFRIFSQGTPGEMLVQRLRDFAMLGAAIPFLGPRLLGTMLFGLWIWRRGVLGDLDGHRALLISVRNLGLLIGLPLNVVAIAIQRIFHPHPMAPSLAGWFQFLVMSVGIPALALGYACAILLWARPGNLRPFAAVGRMALTNYLLQSLVCTTIFNAYGGALFGTTGLVAGLVVTFAVYGAQVPFSVWWISRYRFGPMEWLWRRLIYGPSIDSSNTARAA
jgi:uncharacterized protein